MTEANPEHILIIKLSALGDFVQALGHMRAIRQHHKNAHITLMTTKAFAEFGLKSGYIDDILMDPRPKTFDILGWIKLRKKFINRQFVRIYDLQNNDRTKIYMKLFKNRVSKPEWVSTHDGAKFQNTTLNNKNSHAIDRHIETLKSANVTGFVRDDLSWLKSDISQFGITKPYAVLVPGSAPSRPEKRWPAKYYGDLANYLMKQNITPVLIGTNAEKDVVGTILNICPKALNLLGKTTLYDLPEIGRNANIVVGNDTGPMHMIGATNTKCLVLFSKHSDPTKHAPKGDNISVLQKPDLDNLSVESVWEIVSKEINQ